MPILTVTTPALDRALATVAQAKARLLLPGDDTTHDQTLLDWLVIDSDRLAGACQIAPDQDGQRTFAFETMTVSFAAEEVPEEGPLLLPWRVPARVQAVRVGGLLLDATEREAAPMGAMLHRKSGGRRCRWGSDTVEVDMTAGWTLVGMLPVLRDAVLRLIKARWDGHDRNSLLKATETEGVGRDEYWVGAVDAGPIPKDILASLRSAGLRNPTIGIG